MILQIHKMTIVPLVIFLLSLTPIVQTSQLYALYPHEERVPEHLLFNIKTTGAASEYNEEPLTAIGIFAPATVNPASTTTPDRPGRKYKRVVCPPGFTRAGDIIPGLDSSIPTAIHDVAGPSQSGPSVEHVTATDTGGGTSPNSPASQSDPTPNPPALGASPQAGAPSAVSIPSVEHVTETTIGGDSPSVPSIPPGSPPASPSINIPSGIPSKAHDVDKKPPRLTDGSPDVALSSTTIQGPALSTQTPDPPSNVLHVAPLVPAPSAQTPDGPSSLPVEPSPTQSDGKASPATIIPPSVPSVLYNHEDSIVNPDPTQAPDGSSSVPGGPSPSIQGPDASSGGQSLDLHVTEGLQIPASTAYSSLPSSPPQFFVRQAITDPDACIPIPDDSPTGNGASTLQPSAIAQNLPTPITTQVTFTTSESGTLLTGVTIVTTFPGLQEIQPVPITTQVTLTTSISGTLQTVVTLVTTTPPPVPINPPQPTTTLITFTTSISGTLQTVVTLVTTTPSLINPTTESITYVTLISGTPETKVTLLTEEAFVGYATGTATTTPFSDITILLDWPVPTTTTTSQSGFGGSFSTYRDGITFWIGIMCGFIIIGVWF